MLFLVLLISLCKLQHHSFVFQHPSKYPCLSHTAATEPLSVLFITILLSSAKDLTACHSSLDILEYFKSEDGISKKRFSTSLKKHLGVYITLTKELFNLRAIRNENMGCGVNTFFTSLCIYKILRFLSMIPLRDLSKG